MPVSAEIFDHEVYGPALQRVLEQWRRDRWEEAFRQGWEEAFRQAWEEGFRQGWEQGRKEVRDEVLSRVIVSRLGVISAPIRARIAELAEEEWDVVFDRALSASSVEDLFPARSCVNAKGQPN